MGKIAEIIQGLKKDSESLKGLVSAVGKIGKHLGAVGAVFAVLDVFTGDPVMNKLNEISGQITALDSKITEQFRQQTSIITSTICWNSLDRAINVVTVADSAYRLSLQ